MKQRTMTLEQAYRYVLRRVDRETRKQALISLEKAKKNESYMFCAWDRYDAMMFFLECHGNPFVVDINDGTYKKV